MSTINKKSVASQALLEMDSIKDAIKESSNDVLKSLLKETVQQFLREDVEKEDDDYEVVDDEKDAEDKDKEETSDSKSGDVSEDENVDDNPMDGQQDQQMPQDAQLNADTAQEDEPVGAQEAPAQGEGEDDEWSQFNQYQVGDNTYDLTGEEDYEQLVKVYKLMKDTDNVVVKKDGDTVSLQDNETGAEYVIDLSDDSADNVEMQDDSMAMQGNGEGMAEGHIKENAEDVAGLPGDDDDEDDDDDFDSDDDRSEMPWDYGKHFESKKGKKVMKENKNLVFEVDLGYTDNYQKQDPIDGLSNSEPSKSGKSWEKGVPTGTEKPWAGSSKDKGEPFEKTVKENDEATEEPVVDEATNVGGAVQQRSNSKSHIPDNRKEHGPKPKRHVSAGADYQEVVEAYKKENKALKECIVSLRKGLQESRVTNVNLAKITKLFLENAVSKEEKVNIVNRFTNEAKTVEQSNALYESIKKDLDGKNVKQNLTLESSMTVEGSNAKQLNETRESKPQGLLETLDLIRRIENC